MRIIYSLLIDLGCDLLGQPRELIAPLDQEGNSPFVKPITKRRTIDLRVGDRLEHDGHRYRVRQIVAYRENVTSASNAARDGDGYVVRTSSKPSRDR